MGDAERVFRSSIGAEPMITKGAGDFATETDMKIEQRVRETLAERTGLPVFGEEGRRQPGRRHCVGGGPGGWDVEFFRRATPMCSTIVSLLHYGTPVVGVISLPMLGKRLTAVHGSPLYVNGVATNPGGVVAAGGAGGVRFDCVGCGFPVPHDA